MLEKAIVPEEPIEIAVKRLAEFFRILSNPRRILIIEELRDGEKDVSSLASALRLQQSAVSQHVAVLRAYKLIIERKQGRNVFYRLSDPEMASWIVSGLKFAGPNPDDTELFLLGIEQAKSAWTQNQ